jgi:uncharacterized protein
LTSLQPAVISRGMKCWPFLFLLLPGCSSLGTFSPFYSLERQLIYPAQPATVSPQPNDVHFTAVDGTRLHGRYFAVEHAKAVILFCHGNAGDVESWSPTAAELSQQQQCNVFLFDYRGYGQSRGSPTEAGILADARAARHWLAQQAGVPETDIVLYGRSLGGGVAVDLASKEGARGLILHSTFTSLPDVAATFLPWLLPHWNMTQRFDSLSKIANYHGPLLQGHGDQDRLIPLAMGQRLHAAAPGRKRFVTVRGAGHNDHAGAEWEQAVQQFLDELRCSSGSPPFQGGS